MTIPFSRTKVVMVVVKAKSITSVHCSLNVSKSTLPPGVDLYLEYS